MTDSGQLHEKERQFAKVPAALIHDKRISPGAVRCYAHMHWRYGKSHLNFEGRQSIADYLGVSERSISAYIKELEAFGWVVVVEREFNPKTGHYQTPYYHVFEVRKAAHHFRQTYQCAEGEHVRDLPKLTNKELHKSRKGIGGRKANRVNSSSPGNSSSHGEGNHPVNSSSTYLDAVKDYPDAAGDDLPPRPTIFKLLEDLTGQTLTGLLVEDLKDAAKEYAPDWIEDAFKEAAKSNGRNWKYVLAILERWRREGKGTQKIVAPAVVLVPHVAPTTPVGEPMTAETLARLKAEREAAHVAAGD